MNAFLCNCVGRRDYDFNDCTKATMTARIKLPLQEDIVKNRAEIDTQDAGAVWFMVKFLYCKI